MGGKKVQVTLYESLSLNKNHTHAHRDLLYSPQKPSALEVSGSSSVSPSWHHVTATPQLLGAGHCCPTEALTAHQPVWSVRIWRVYIALQSHTRDLLIVQFSTELFSNISAFKLVWQRFLEVFRNVRTLQILTSQLITCKTQPRTQ